MKIRLLLIAIFVLALQIQTNAAVSVEETLTQEYLQNNGYSKQIYDTVTVGRARALGKEFYSSEEIRYQNKSPWAKRFKKIHAYIDPAIDDYSFYHHNNTPEPTYSDL